MYDIWSFLLQTAYVSSIALILLILKAVFKNTLAPKWHFAMWGILGIFSLIPAGVKNTNILFNQGFILELLKGAAGEYGTTAVTFPFPVIAQNPKTVADYIFIIYTLGVFAHLAFYAISYIKLRFIIKKGSVPSAETLDCIESVCEKLDVKPCKAVELDGINSAFICGIINPVLVLPKGLPQNSKVILHELVHLKKHDTVWSVFACAIKSVHWCNPLIVYCANAAIVDMERRCDQFVLEELSGEERREYGRLLIGAANNRFTKTPGTTCICNGGKNIKKRIEAIAKFKLYPKGMRLVSACIALILCVWVFMGAGAPTFKGYTQYPKALLSAGASSTPCTTYAGAFDTYAMAVIKQNIYYRLMCASESDRKELLKTVKKLPSDEEEPTWNPKIPCDGELSDSYAVINLEKLSGTCYRGLLIFRPSPGKNNDNLSAEEKAKLGFSEETHTIRLITQTVTVNKKQGRWTATPCGELEMIYVSDSVTLQNSEGLPAIVYTGVSGDYLLKLEYRTVHLIVNESYDYMEIPVFWNSNRKRVPDPDAKFTRYSTYDSYSVTNISGTAKEGENYGISVLPVKSEKSLPESLATGSSGATGYFGFVYEGSFKPNETSYIGGGGTTSYPSKVEAFPESYSADFYIDGEVAESLELTRDWEATK